VLQTTLQGTLSHGLDDVFARTTALLANITASYDKRLSSIQSSINLANAIAIAAIVIACVALVLLLVVSVFVFIALRRVQAVPYKPQKDVPMN
jgi:uncharacterized membrane protein